MSNTAGPEPPSLPSWIIRLIRSRGVPAKPMCAHQPLVVSRSPAARFLTGRPSSPSAVDVAFQLLEPAVRKALQETADPLILVNYVSIDPFRLGSDTERPDREAWGPDRIKEPPQDNDGSACGYPGLFASSAA